MNNCTLFLSTALLALAPCSTAVAQCPVGELEVIIQVSTDDYGNETLWQLVESGNDCGESPIFTGGNPAITCANAGNGQSPNGGYDANTVIEEGPFCLVEGASYDIISMDSYGDAQASFTVLVNGGYAGVFSGEGGSTTHTFVVTAPLERDMMFVASTTGFYCEVGLPVIVAGTVQNVGGQPVTSFDITYTIDGGGAQTETITTTLDPGEQYDFKLAAPWTPTEAGTNAFEVSISSVNNDIDQATANNATSVEMIVNPVIPDLSAQYLFAAPTLTVVGTGDDDILVPRDLDFHPDRSRNELWVINKDVPATGGSTVLFHNPGEAGQTYLLQRDVNARHFMSLPTGIAMGDNGNFSTCPGIWDANQNQATTTPFTGPTLWSADPEIYAQNLFGPLGSHLDMLHVTPKSQGIAHERWNKYWVVDGANQDVVMHDYRSDHGPGNDYHGNAIIHRYPEVSITRDPGDHIVSHCVVDKHTSWLYVVDHGGQRVLRLDTRSGTIAAGAPDFGPYESYVEYKNMTGATWEVVVDAGLQQPSGIDVVGDRLLVSDHGTGEIIIYNMADDFAEMGRIAATPGIMGIKVGPDGRIWYVNATSNTLVRVDPSEIVGVQEQGTTQFHLAPNPAKEFIYLTAPAGLALNTPVEVRDAAGRICQRTTVSTLLHGLDIHALAEGAYTVTAPGQQAQRFVVAR